MKQSLLLLALSVSLFTCSPKTYTRVPSGKSAGFFGYHPNQTPKISAHRGGGDLKGYPENCIESFAFLAKQMPVVIECDIDLTKDSVLVMMHDQTLDRTTTGTGKLIDKTYAELAPFRLEDNMGNLTPYTIPTLEQVLRWGKGKVTFTLDVKRNVSFDKVVDIVSRTGAGD